MIWFCRGCGAGVDVSRPGVRTCPNRGGGDGDVGPDVDHVLEAPVGRGEPDGSFEDPFLRYRARLGSYAVARELGWSDDRFVELVGALGSAVGRVWSPGFLRTPTSQQPVLRRAIGLAEASELWVKDETVNVSGSHKARHLFGLARWMSVRRDEFDRLAISSCGNAAMAAAVIAKAWGRPLDVFVPDWAGPAVVDRLADLGARVVVCGRGEGEVGDPCMLRFREAVAAGAVPFGCQGPDNALTIDGGRTIGWELAEQVPNLDEVYVQLGGGALGTALAAGLREGGSRARVVAVQAEGCAPFDRAWRRVAELGGSGSGLSAAIRRRSTAMWAWEAEPRSAATGILDDETYDWAGVCAGLIDSEGDSVVATEAQVRRAHRLAHELTAIDVDATGTAGLAGLLANLEADPVGLERQRSSAVLFTGLTRH